MPRIVVLRIGHRIPRDWRLTTHVCLTARALGADGVMIADILDKGVEETVRDVNARFGGKFWVESGKPWRQAIKDWKAKEGLVVHLTVYGLPLPKVLGSIRAQGKDVLLVVGSEKVPGQMFGSADFNVSVTSQPMSEVAALSIFLDWYHEHREFDHQFPGGKVRIMASEKGKKLEELADSFRQ